jgi:hypothetical protein
MSDVKRYRPAGYSHSMRDVSEADYKNGTVVNAYVDALDYDTLVIDCNTLRAANDGLHDSYLENLRAKNVLLAALDEALEYFDDCADVIDGDYGEPAPNKAMLVAQSLRAAIKSVKP